MPWPTSVDLLIKEVRATWGEPEADVMQSIVEWADAHRLRHTLTPRNPTKGIGYQPAIRGIEGWDPWPIDVYPQLGVVVVEIGWLRKRRPFDSESLQTELRQRLQEAVPDVDWSERRKSHFPDVSLRILSQGDALADFLRVIDWVVERIRRFYQLT